MVAAVARLVPQRKRTMGIQEEATTKDKGSPDNGLLQLIVALLVVVLFTGLIFILARGFA